jgi:hypothetical protein
LRFYVIDKTYQAIGIGGDAARGFMAWLADGAIPLLAGTIQSWLSQPADAGRRAAP